MAPPPRAQKADKRTVEADEQNMSAFVFKIQANMDPNHRDRIAFARLCSGKLTRGMKVKQVRTGKSISLNAPQFFFAQDRSRRRRGLCRRRGRHPEPRRDRDRRHADRGRGYQFRRRAELRAGNPAPRAAAGRHEGEEAEGGVAAARGGGRGPGVPPAGRLAGAGRRGRSAAARRAAGAAQGRIRPRSRCGTPPSSRWPAGSPPTIPRCWRSSSPTTGSASPTISTAIRSIWRATNSIWATPRERAPGIKFTDVKDRHANGKVGVGA